MLSNDAYRERQIMRRVSQRVEGSDRYVDASVILEVVTTKPTPGKRTIQLGDRMLWVLREHQRGGWIDTKSVPPYICGFSENPTRWQCSEDQEGVILHDDTDPVGKLALGGMGAGKTTAGVIWLFWRWTESIGSNQEGGITAPTETRLSMVFNEMFAKFPRSWWKYNSETKVCTMCDGFRWRGVSTHRQSEKQGSRVQQFNWVALFMDELQDQVDEFVNAQARLRSKEDGRAKRVATATAKDHPEWRTLKDGLLGSGLWVLHSMLGPNSPFIHPSHWEAMRKVTTDRDYRRLVLAEDLPPESRLYNTFDRKENMRPVPRVGARRITSVVLYRKTGSKQDSLLMGHDPGAAKAATVWLEAYELNSRPGEVLWWVRDELFTLHESVEVHATKALKKTRERFGVNMRPDGEQAHVRCQPLGAAEDKPDMNTFAIWKRIGFDIKWARYNEQGKGGQIKKESRIGMINTLFCNADGRRRLFIECDDRGVSCAPQLVAALETMERDHLGRPEHEEKHVRYDKSDLPAALGYALYAFERETASALRADVRRQLGA